MKKCPYCAEDIQDQAIKCRYCNEWFDKKNPLFNVIEKARNYIKEKTTEYQQKKNEHLFFPSETHPFKVGNIHLYPDKLVILGSTIPLKNVMSIYYAGIVSEINYIADRRTIFLILFEKEDSDKNLFTLTLAAPSGVSIIGPDYSKKTFEQLAFINQYISNITFEQRLKTYTDQLRETGLFLYETYSFSNEGNILKGNKIIANLMEAYNNNSIVFGSAWAGLKSSSKDPYQFIILSGAPRMKILGFESGNKLKIQTHTDHDVFESLISHYLKYERYPTL